MVDATGIRRGRAFPYRPTAAAGPLPSPRTAILAAGSKPTIGPTILATGPQPIIRPGNSSPSRFSAAFLGQPSTAAFGHSSAPVGRAPSTAAIGQAVASGKTAGQPAGTRNGGIGWASGLFRRLFPRQDIFGPAGRFGRRAVEFPEPVVIRTAADLSWPEDGIFSRGRCWPDVRGIFRC